MNEVDFDCLLELSKKELELNHNKEAEYLMLELYDMVRGTYDEYYLAAVNNLTLALFRQEKFNQAYEVIEDGIELIYEKNLYQLLISQYVCDTWIVIGNNGNDFRIAKMIQYCIDNEEIIAEWNYMLFLYWINSIIDSDSYDKRLIEIKITEMYDFAIQSDNDIYIIEIMFCMVRYEVKNGYIEDAKQHFMYIYDYEIKTGRKMYNCYNFVCMYPEILTQLFQKEELKEILFVLVRKLPFQIDRLSIYQDEFSLFKRISHIGKLITYIVSYAYSGIIECSDEELAEVIINGKSLYSDILYNLKIISGSNKLYWLSIDDFSKKLPKDAVYVDYIQYPVSIKKNQYLGELQYGGVALYWYKSKLRIIKLNKRNLLVVRAQYMILNALVRTKESEEKKLNVEMIVGDERKIYLNLYRLLLKQVLDSVKENKKKLIISGDVELNSIPFDLLLDEKEHFMLDIYDVFYVNSLRNFTEDDKVEIYDTKDMLALGNPKFSVFPETKQYIDNDNYLLPLPFSKIEVQTVADILKINACLGQDASKQKLFNNDYVLVHIATHGKYLPMSEEEEGKVFPLSRCFIYFSGANDSFFCGYELEEFGNGCVSAEELCRMNFENVQLLVLSACFSGFGEVSYTQGLLGIRTALLSHKIPFIVLSLWEVDDFASAVFMEYFYNKIIYEKLPVPKALNDAKRYLRTVTLGKLKKMGWFKLNRIKRFGLVADTMLELSLCSDEIKLFEKPKYWAGFILLK